MRLGLILAILGVSACAAQAERKDAADLPAVAQALPPPAPESVADPILADSGSTTIEVADAAAPAMPSDLVIINDHLDAEVVVIAALERLAFDAIARLTTASDPDTVGPELRWFPALGLVSAMERRVVYGRPAVSEAVARTGDPDRPFQIKMVVPCQVTTRSGDGVAVVGTMPEAAAVVRDALPRSTTVAGLATVPEHLREAADRAIAACQEREAVSETIMVEVSLVYDRLGETFVLP